MSVRTQTDMKMTKLKHLLKETEEQLPVGIVELRDGLTVDKLRMKYPWVANAKTKDAVVGEDIGGVVWYDGTWIYGIWQGGTWEDGTWKGGFWKGGIWEDGRWEDGMFEKGIWKGGQWDKGTFSDGTWEDGTWRNGEWLGGEWKGGTWLNGEFKYSTWEDGTWKGGEFIDSIWENGTWKTGEWRGTYNEWKKGTWEDGTWHGGIWRKGKWKGGTWLSGNWKGGTWEDGIWKGGMFENGTWKGGEWHGGVWKRGNWKAREPHPNEKFETKIKLGQLLKENTQVTVTKMGDLDVVYNGETYRVGYPADGYNTPYGIVFPGEDVFRNIRKDKDAKRIWKKLEPIVNKYKSLSEGRLLGTSPSLDGIQNIISQYLMGSTITLDKISDRPETYSVSTKKGKSNNYKVVKKGKRYRFEEI